MARKSSRPPRQFHSDEEEGIPYIPPRLEEQLLITYLSSYQIDRALCTSFGRGQLAGFLASQNPESRILCHYLDSHFAQLAREYWETSDTPPQVICTADFPEEEFDAVCIPVHRQGNAELTRDLLQQGHQRLREGGELIAAVNNPRDHWLYEQYKTLFSKVTRIVKKQGVIYKGKKAGPLKKIRDFRAEFTVPFAGRQLLLTTRPGVFSHRHLDDGAWALMKSLSVREGMRVMDLGCGCGAVGIAAMLSAENVQVTAVDSYTRAVACTQRNAELNLTPAQLARFQVQLSHSGKLNEEGYFDLVATNPPYFSNFKIAELFINAAKQVLKPRGELLIVTKMPEWYEEHLPGFFTFVDIEPVGHYSVVAAHD